MIAAQPVLPYLGQVCVALSVGTLAFAGMSKVVGRLRGIPGTRGGLGLVELAVGISVASNQILARGTYVVAWAIVTVIAVNDRGGTCQCFGRPSVIGMRHIAMNVACLMTGGLAVAYGVSAWFVVPAWLAGTMAGVVRGRAGVRLQCDTGELAVAVGCHLCAAALGQLRETDCASTRIRVSTWETDTTGELAWAKGVFPSLRCVSGSKARVVRGAAAVGIALDEICSPSPRSAPPS